MHIFKGPTQEEMEIRAMDHPNYIMLASASRGYLPGIKAAMENGALIEFKTIAEAVINDQEEVVFYLINNIKKEDALYYLPELINTASMASNHKLYRDLKNHYNKLKEE